MLRSHNNLVRKVGVINIIFQIKCSEIQSPKRFSNLPGVVHISPWQRPREDWTGHCTHHALYTVPDSAVRRNLIGPFTLFICVLFTAIELLFIWKNISILSYLINLELVIRSIPSLTWLQGTFISFRIKMMTSLYFH